MEQMTIGKRIQALRKSRSMTQDQLAERLGVSPQAVSKWEHDISCPDISLLPKLAEVFGVTADSLLGIPEKVELVETPPKAGVYVKPDDTASEEGPGDDHSFTLHWDTGRNELPFFAVGVLVFAVAMLLNRTVLSFLGEAGGWSLLWPSAVLALGVSALWSRVSLWSVGATVLGGVFLLKNLHILPDLPGVSWHILWPVLLVLWAVSMLMEHFRGEKDEPKTKHRTYEAEDGEVTYEAAFCSETVPVAEAPLVSMEADLAFGDYTLDFTACGDLAPGCRLEVDLSFGSLDLVLPRDWNLREVGVDRSFSGFTYHGQPAEDAGQTLLLEADVSFGQMNIRWEGN